ncbi:MAG: hypothetical protein A2Y17_07960 [Clostridiales bacterium GWF2_38_85]|nr:MAG: hypothetical protein A2Y17_07960 [Clostridiales bacterium GWF2_38_85]
MDKYATANLLYELRIKHNYTQNELASIIGVSNKAVSKWETGASKPKIDTLYKLAALYKTTIDELLSSNQNDITFNEQRIIEPDFSKFETITAEQKDNAFQKYEDRQEKLYGKGRIYARIFAVYYITNIVLYAISIMPNSRLDLLKLIILASRILLIFFFLKGRFWARITMICLFSFSFFIDLLYCLGLMNLPFYININDPLGYAFFIIYNISISVEFIMFIILIKSKALRTYLEYQDV